MANTPAVAAGQKIPRKFLAHFINTAAGSATAAYVRLGKDLEEFTAEMSANVEKKQNILGETSVMVTSYEKSSSVEPHYAVVGDPLYARLQDIIDNSKVLDDCNCDVVDVKLWEAPVSGAYPAIKWNAVIEVTSYGGDTTGYQIPFNLHYTGEKVAGFFNPTTKAFTETAPTGV
ncbi:MAG: hypothetical protein RSF82_11920 [Angelakisella sp.]